MLLLITILYCAVSTSAIGILLPLYVYPGSKASAWIPVNQAVAAYPSVQWSIVINPRSGPGTTTSSPYPNADYIAGIKALNKYPNVKLLGYVDTLWGNRPIASVSGDIDRYAEWERYQAADLSMDGIFFDDVTSIYDFNMYPTTLAGNETYYKNVTAYASTMISSNVVTPVVCNSGVTASPSFFKFCGTMVEFERSYAIYNDKLITSLIKDGGIMDQSAIIMYSAPTTLSLTDLRHIINPMKSVNVQYVDMTNDCCYNALNGTLLRAIAAVCNEADSGVANTTIPFSSVGARLPFSSVANLCVQLGSLLVLAMFQSHR